MTDVLQNELAAVRETAELTGTDARLTEDGLSVIALPHTLISNSNMLRQRNNGTFSSGSQSSQWMRTFLPESWHISSAGHTRVLIGPGGGA